MSYYEASRKVDSTGTRRTDVIKEKLFESPWISGQQAEQAAPMNQVLSYYEVVKRVRTYRQKIYESNWILWERIRLDSSSAWVQILKFQDRWLLLATDETGRNFRECSSEEDCYKAIENVIPECVVTGSKKNGVIEIQFETALSNLIE